MLLTDYPQVRQDSAMMRAYMFLIDFLEAISKETFTMLRSQQSTMKELLEAAKSSEQRLNEYFASNIDKVASILSAVFQKSLSLNPLCAVDQAGLPRVLGRGDRGSRSQQPSREPPRDGQIEAFGRAREEVLLIIIALGSLKLSCGSRADSAWMSWCFRSWPRKRTPRR